MALAKEKQSSKAVPGASLDAAVTADASTEFVPLANLRTHYKDIIAIFPYGFAIGIAGSPSCWQTSKTWWFLARGFLVRANGTPRGSKRRLLVRPKLKIFPQGVLNRQRPLGRCGPIILYHFFYSRTFCLISSLLLSKDVVFVMERWQASVTYLETLKIYRISGVVFQCWVVKQLVLTAHPSYVSGCCQRVCLFSDKGTTGGQTLYTCATSLGSEECHESDNFAWCLPVIC